MKKRITSVLLALALCLTLLPTAALAAEGDNVDHDPHAGIALTMQDNNLMKDSSTWTPDTISPPSITGYKGYLFDGGTYYLNENLTLAYPIAIKGNVKLCLNGHTITYAGDNESAISLENFGDDSTAHLTLTDCSTGADHLGTISGGKGKVVMMQGPSQLDMYGGIITGSKGNGVLVSSECTFNMYGGKITGNGGWGVDISEGKFDMSGGTITGNTSYGVHVGPYNNDNSNVFNVSGKATITGNGTEGTAKNVYLGKDQTIHVTGEFTGTIGVTAQNPSAETPIVTPNRIGFNQGTFTSDDGAYGIDSADDNSGIVKLKAHEWKYALKSGSKDTITATCDCGAEGGSVTIKAPDADKLTYDGTAKEATLVPNGWRGADVDNSMITYRYNSGDSTYRPTDTTTDAGAYTVTVTCKTSTDVYTGTTTFTIAPKSIEDMTVALKENEFVYNGTEQSVTVESVGELTAADYTVTDDNAATNVGTYTVTVTGKGNYGGETKATWTIAPKELTVQSATVNFKTYDGTKNADVSEVKFNGLVDDTLIRSTDYAVKAEFDSADAADSCTATVTVTLKDTIAAKNYTLTNTDCKGSAAIKKASQTVTIPSGKSITKNGVGVDISTWASAAGVPGGSEPGKLTYSLTGGAYNGVTLDGTVLTVQKEATAESIIIKVQAADTKNYEASEGKTFTVTVTNKETVEISVTYADKTYDGKAIAPAGTLTVEGDKVPAKDLEVLYESTDGKGYNKTEAPKDAGAYKVTYKVADSNENYTGSVTRAFTISPRKVTVAPADKNMTKGSAIPTFELTSKDLVAGDTLKPNKAPKFSCFEKDNVAVSTSTAAGTYTITWTNMDGTTFDNGNYTVTTSATGTLTISNRSSGGGSSSDRDSHDSNPVIKTETKNNADGSTTKTETRKDGSVTQTTTGKDGSVSKTETKKDGSSVTENKAADGSTGTVKTDKNGQTEAKTALSNKAIEDAKKSGEAVKAPVEVKATKNSSTAPTVKVELPKNSGETKVEIPVSNVKPGTVAVLVHPDGTEEIVKNSLPTEDGIQLTVNGSATVKIVDNSKDFVDTRNHWAREEIDFVSARELVNGISATRYAPDATATRAQLWTILARQNDTDLSGGANWYEKAQLWSKDKGISDGTNPNGTINRAQMVTMLWRTMGQPAAGGSASFADVPADSYYAQAVAWAIENGITAGVGGGRFDPNSTCARAQIATFLARSMK